jgi:hypothetical protein
MNFRRVRNNKKWKIFKNLKILTKKNNKMRNGSTPFKILKI